MTKDAKSPPSTGSLRALAAAILALNAQDRALLVAEIMRATLQEAQW